MSFVLLGILNSQALAAGGGYFISTLGDPSSAENFGQVEHDSTGGFFMIGRTNNASGAGSYDPYISRFDSSGDVLWQRTLGSSGFEDARGIAVDSADNVLVAANDASVGRDPMVAKYNASGTLQWQRIISTGNFDDMFDVAVDSSDNIYTISRVFNGSHYAPHVASFDSSGSIRWQKEFTPGSNTSEYRLTVDSSNNVFVTFGWEGGDGTEIHISQLNPTTGADSWQIRIDNSDIANEDTVPYGIIKGPSGYLYVAGRTDNNSNRETFLTKINPASQAVLWARTLNGAVSDDFAGISLDADENIYVVGRTSSEGQGSNEMLIAKYDSDGIIQFQRTLGTTGSELAYGISILENTMIITGSGLAPSAFIIAGLPTDGSLEGTYTVGTNDFTYAASTLTANTVGTTRNFETLSYNTTTYTISASSLTSNTVSFTQEKTTI